MDDIHLRRAQGVVAQNFVWNGIVHYDKYRAQTFGPLLLRILAQIVIKRWLAAMKSGAVVAFWVENLLFKHA